MKILIADDNVTNRKLLRVMLQAEGYETVEAADGNEALEILESEDVSLILSDVLMPNMDGFRLCHAVRHTERLKHIPFIIQTSSYDSSSDERLAISFGADLFIRRPISSNELLGAVRRTVGQTRPRQSPRAQSLEELDVMKTYSVRLVRQLEDTNAELANAHAKILDIHQSLLKRTDELEQSEEKFRGIFENITDVFFRTDMQGTIQIVSPSIRRYGHDPSTLIGCDFRELCAKPGDYDMVIGALVEGQVLEDKELALKQTAGKWSVSSLSARLITDVQRRPIEIEGVLRDISERKQVEEVLRASETFYRSLGDAVPDFVWACDAQGRANFINRRYLEYTGYTLEEMSKLRLDAYHHPDDLPDLQAKWQSASAKREGYEAEARYKRHDGEYRWFLIRAVPVKDIHGNTIQWVGTSTDIHERKRLEEQLLHSQKLEAIGRLAGGIAHDFNNLLTAILGYSELAEEEVAADTTASRYLKTIQGAATRAAALTHQLLAFARQQIIEPRVLTLNDILDDVSSLLRPLLGEHIELAIMPGNDLWRIRVDPGQLEQVIVNLAVNAADAMPQGGRLLIETENITLDEGYAYVHPDLQPGEYVLLAVSDTGEGMDEALQKRVFDPFFTTKAKGKGTGLGLSTCHGIIKQSGGHIWLYSEPGRGTTFRIYLPRVQAAATRPPTPPEVMDMHGVETVLLVEDEAIVREMAVQALRSQGYTVIAAENGDKALEYISGHSGEINLLLTDVVMPHMGGRQLAERLEEIEPGVHVLYTSGYTDNFIAQHGVLAEGTAFLQKPYTPTTLVRKVRQTLNRAATSSAE